jgi:MFS family permease
MTTVFAKLFAGRMHYGWVVLAVMFSASMAGVGVRAAPGVMIVPLQHAFGWDVSTISAAVSINIILLGVTGPFLTGLTEVIGLKRTILSCMVMLMAGSGLSVFMTSPWHLFLTWGLLVGIGSGAGAIGIAAAVANRWFVERNGLAMGLLFSAAAAGQLVFVENLSVAAPSAVEAKANALTPAKLALTRAGFAGNRRQGQIATVLPLGSSNSIEASS